MNFILELSNHFSDASWCMYSKALHPEFDIVAREMRRLRGNVLLAKIDADLHKGVQEPFGIEGFPTVLLFLNGTKAMSIPYDYERKACNIIQWLREYINF